MYDIYCGYTMYIKKIWAAYAENLNVIYIVYVKYTQVNVKYMHDIYCVYTMYI